MRTLYLKYRRHIENIELTAHESEEPTELQRADVFLLDLLFLLSGVFGLLAVTASVRGVSFSYLPYLYAAGLCTLLCLAHWRSKMLFVCAYIGSIAVIGWVIYSWRAVLLEQFAYFLGSLFGETQNVTTEFEQAAVVLGLLLAFIMFTFECFAQMHGPLYVATTAILAVSPFLAVRIDAMSLLPLIVFQISFWALHNVRKYGGRKDVVLPGRRSVARKGSLLTVLVLILCFFIVSPLLLPYADSLYAAANEVEGFASRTFQNAKDGNEDMFLDGQVSRGNNYRTGAEKLKLELSQAPTETLYLRGFAGGDYVGGSWEPADEEADYVNMERILQWGKWSSSISPMYHNMYYYMNEHQMGLDRPDSTHLIVWHLDGNYDHTYTPYYGVQSGGWNYHRSKDKREDGGWRYSYRFFRQSEMDISWENTFPEYDLVRDWYIDLQDAYMQVCQEPYTRVPINRLPKLMALVEENPLEDLDDITTFILYVLQNGAQYDLAPGWAPVNEDIAEYFLFERKSGYCVHFATTATLLYRLYGIPARYATGYAISPSQFEAGPDYTSSTIGAQIWTADVTDESAHAWVEIFLPDFGWTPVEVTPSVDGQVVTSYPGFDPSTFTDVLQTQGWNAMTLLAEDETTVSDTAVSQEAAFFPHISAAAASTEVSAQTVWFYACLCVAAIVCVWPVLVESGRMRRMWMVDTLSCRQLFGRLMELLRFCGKLTDCDGNETDFPQRLAASVSGVSVREAQRVTSQVQSAAYGPQDCAPVQTSELQHIYRQATQSLPQELSPFRRWVGKYVKRLF